MGLAWLALVVSATAVQAAPLSPPSTPPPPPPPIVNGEETGDWPGVGVLVALDPSSGSGGVFCSATLVDDTAVVTAAHCVDSAEQYSDWGYDTVFAVGPSVAEIVDYVEVEAWSVHPDYRFTSAEVFADIAVGFLSGPLGGGVEPVSFLSSELGTGWYDEDLVLVGYGITSDGAEDAGTKRTATLPVYTLYGDFVLAIDDDPSGSNACSGDSGGAALRQTSSGVQLAGVLSFVFAWHEASNCVGGGVGATRLDLFGPWLRNELGGGGGGGLGGGESDSGSLGGEDPKGCSHLPAMIPLFVFPLLLLRRRPIAG